MKQTQSEIDLKIKGFKNFIEELESTKTKQNQILFQIEEMQVINNLLINCIKQVVLKNFKKYEVKVLTDCSLKIINPLTGRPVDFISILDVCKLSDNINESFEDALEKAEEITKDLFPLLQTIIL